MSRGANQNDKNHATTSPLVAVVGQTATGKSEAAVSLAEEFSGEIIAADSWTVRQEFNIGTAKPDKTTQSRVAHHLLDIVAPCADFNAAEFKKRATIAMGEIHARHKLPILVGGTGLYIDSVLFDYSFSPPGDAQQRQVYNDMTLEQLQELAQEKELNTSSIDMRNKRRVIRLLETNGAQPQKKLLRANSLVIGMSTPQADYRQRVEQRVDNMLLAGLEREVRQLADTYGWECEGLKGIGYREWRPYFSGKTDLTSVRSAIVRSTLQLAKRQRTWFRQNKSIQWCETYEEARQKMYAFINS